VTISTDANYLDIMLLGKEYRVACPPGERQALLATVAYVDEKMHEIAEKTKSSAAERIAVMAALNIAHEHLSGKQQTNPIDPLAEAKTALDFGAVKRRISVMEAQLEAVLAPQEKLL
jgi:cell division protein ZapA